MLSKYTNDKSAAKRSPSSRQLARQRGARTRRFKKTVNADVMLDRVSKRYRDNGIIPFSKGAQGRVVHVEKNKDGIWQITVKRDDRTSGTYSMFELDEAVYS